MKYPQLVSTRAVNAISDWLVSRLEQLGVEAPQIYTRLLLSLLQSSVQINDPIEFSNLETFFANRKGGNRRHLPCDKDTLKKLNAVHCLKEIVSSEQEIETIENLVDELCEKLKDIEKQSSDVEDDNNLLIATLSVATVSTVSGTHAPLHSQLQYHANSKHQHHHHNYSNRSQREEQKDRREGIDAAAASVDIETDPKKRYFSAFPALSKEMEDSFRIWRRNAKSLTWPVDRSNISVSSSSSSSTLSRSFDADNLARASEERVVAKVGNSVNSNSLRSAKIHKGGSVLSNLSNCNNTTISSAGAGGVKRKSKRRRNQALSKGKTIQNIRKNSSGVASIGGGVSGAFGGRHHRHSSPTYWDTDFEGCWEMGRDLIKEFIVKQNKNNRYRNRSTSESAAYNMKNDELGGALEYETAKHRRPTGQAIVMNEYHDESKDADHVVVAKTSPTTSPIMPVVDISFCDDEYDDSLASVSELASDTRFNTAAVSLRLYQREAGFGSRELLSEEETAENQLDFARLKAKFNSSVEALWKDAEPITDPGIDVFSYTSSSIQMPSLPTVAPFKENLKNFWTNYYNHHFDLAKIPQQCVTMPTAAPEMDESMSLSYCVSGSASHVDAAGTSDYYSMPNNWQDFDKSVGGACRDFNVGGTNEGRNTPVGVFLQNSIWSNNLNGGAAGDTDESFYYKVWNSNKKLTQLEALRENKLHMSGVSKTHDNALHFPSHPHSKWSEGINAEPHAPQQKRLQSHLKSRNSSTSNQNISVDCTDSSATASVSSTSCSSLSNTHSSAAAAAYNWQTPIQGQSLQTDFQSWPNLNPMSLTEMYGGSAAASNVTASDAGKHIDESAAPSITLSNHSSKSSGFVEYALIKSETKACKQERAQQQLKYAAQYLRPKERYTEDENLLTSERTHFHPIKTYADGHTFDICSALDAIDYERSGSGYLYLESEKYLEYTRSDNCLAEEDTGAASMNPLYAASNCEAAAAARNTAGSKSKISKEFIIKFRMRRCDIACQTDDEAELLVESAATVAINKHAITPQHPLCLILSGASNVKSTGLGCNDAIEALNKAVAAAAKAAAAVDIGQDSDCGHWLSTATSAGNSVWTAVQPSHTLHDEDCCDAADFCANIGAKKSTFYAEDSSHALEKQWSMHEIRKKCMLKGHGNNNEASLHEGIHTLWGMCAACNKECKSVPANRLLRDELKREADEIMSDLKYMQDLYIGRAESEDDIAVAAASDSDWEADVEEELEEHAVPLLDYTACRESSFAVRNLATDKSVKMEQDDDDIEMLPGPGPQAHEMLQKVNRIIADLLRPDNAKETAQPKAASSAADDAVNERETRSGNRSLWCSDGNECSIWHPNEMVTSNRALQQVEQLRNYSMEPHANALRAEEQKFLSQLNWEHTNLAQIWQQNTPPTQQVAGTPASSSAATAVVQAVSHEISQGENTVSEKNCTNLQATDTLSTEHETVSQNAIAAAAYDRVQQFLKDNVAMNTCSKLKLANRKRRHSASQNYSHHHHHLLPGAVATSLTATANTASNNNNNSIDVADLNSFNLKLNSTVFADDIDVQKFINSSLRQALINETGTRSNQNATTVATCDAVYGDAAAGSDAEADLDPEGICGGAGDVLQQRKQTIITCKYWTTIDPMFEAGDMVEGTAFSCLIDKNASILKHVTMVTRPLTR